MLRIISSIMAILVVMLSHTTAQADKVLFQIDEASTYTLQARSSVVQIPGIQGILRVTLVDKSDLPDGIWNEQYYRSVPVGERTFGMFNSKSQNPNITEYTEVYLDCENKMIHLARAFLVEEWTGRPSSMRWYPILSTLDLPGQRPSAEDNPIGLLSAMFAAVGNRSMPNCPPATGRITAVSAATLLREIHNEVQLATGEILTEPPD